MSALPKSSPDPRYGSVTALARYAGLSPKTIRRLVEAGAVRGLKVGRRLIIPFEDADRYILGRCVRPSPGSPSVMATIHPRAEPPYVPPVGPDERARRHRAAVALLDSWEAEGDEREQRETMAVLREALGARRVASSRNLFP
jgi:excisionase family DNA binding protein